MSDYSNAATNLVMLGVGYGLASKMIDSSKGSRHTTARKKSKKHRRVLRRIKA